MDGMYTGSILLAYQFVELAPSIIIHIIADHGEFHKVAPGGASVSPEGAHNGPRHLLCG